MTTKPRNPHDALGLLKALDADSIAARIAELEAEASALRVLLRSARARQNAQKRARKPVLGKRGSFHE